MGIALAKLDETIFLSFRTLSAASSVLKAQHNEF